jgi:TM2 domain-containing membrane protein YozV
MGVIPPPMPMGMHPMGMGMGMVEQKNPGLAVALELLGGTFLQTFGIGHLYAGNVGVGLGLMFGYWALTAINVFLCFVLIGFVTWPLTWIAFMILSAITANTAAKKKNMGLA